MGWENGRQLTTLSKQPPVVISTQPENDYGTVGGTASFTVAASGDRVAYQWQCSTDDGETWSNVNGSTSTTLNIPTQASVNGNLYRCIAKDYMGHVATSQAGRLTVTSSVVTYSEFDPEFTLINEPEILLLDEPLGALDEFTRMNMQDEILNIWMQKKQLALMVTHSIDEAVYMGTRVLVMEANPGRIVADIRIDEDFPRDRSSASFVEYRNEILNRLHFGGKHEK